MLPGPRVTERRGLPGLGGVAGCRFRPLAFGSVAGNAGVLALANVLPWQAEHARPACPPVRENGCLNVEGFQALVVWQDAHLVNPARCWQETQAGLTLANGNRGSWAQARLACAPVSGNGCWKVRSVHAVGVWQEAQSVSPPCSSPWQEMQAGIGRRELGAGDGCTSRLAHVAVGASQTGMRTGPRNGCWKVRSVHAVGVWQEAQSVSPPCWSPRGEETHAGSGLGKLSTGEWHPGSRLAHVTVGTRQISRGRPFGETDARPRPGRSWYLKPGPSGQAAPRRTTWLSPQSGCSDGDACQEHEEDKQGHHFQSPGPLLA